MKVTITKALAELKKIDNRLTAFDFSNMGGVFKNKDKDLIDQKKKDDQALMQSYKDLKLRYAQIKTAIATANINTKVNVNGAEVSLYEMIIRKDDAKLRLQLMKELIRFATKLENDKIKQTEKLDKQIQDIVEKAYGSTKPSGTFIEDITKAQYDVSGPVVVYPYSVDELRKTITELEDSISDFDIKLSEINAKTEIEIPDLK